MEMEEEQLLEPVEPVPTKVVASCMGSKRKERHFEKKSKRMQVNNAPPFKEDNLRYYKIQWSESWASEELLALKYGDLISAYWKEYDDSHKCPIEEQLQEVAADPVFIGSLLTKMGQPQVGDPAGQGGLQEKYGESPVSSGRDQLLTMETSTSESYSIGSFFRPVASPESKDQPDSTAANWFNQPLRPPNLQPQRERPFHCPDCDRSYPTKLRLKDHCRKIHMNRGEYPCTVCPKVFPNKRNLQLHMDRHTGIGPYPCSGCMKRFMTEQEVDHHMRSCSRLVNKEFVCDVCGKAFATKTHLVFHAKIHLPDSEKPFECQYCSRRFSYNHDCIHHMRLHRGEKPYKCSDCPMAFHRKTYLTEHMFVHTGISKHKCDECSTYFKTQQMLQTHVKNVHILKKPPGDTSPAKRRKAAKKKIRYRCDICEKEFRFLKEYHYHKAVNHLDNLTLDEAKKLEFACFEPTMVYKCRKCEKSFQWSSALKKHAETHRNERDSDGDRLTVDVKPDRVRKAEQRVLVRLRVEDERESDSDLHDAGDSERALHRLNNPATSGDSDQSVKTDGMRRSRLARCKICKKTFTNAKSLQTHVTLTHFKSRTKTARSNKTKKRPETSHNKRCKPSVMKINDLDKAKPEEHQDVPDDPNCELPHLLQDDIEPQTKSADNVEATPLDIAGSDTLTCVAGAEHTESILNTLHKRSINIIVREDADSPGVTVDSLLAAAGQASCQAEGMNESQALANAPILSREQLQAILLSGSHPNVRIVTENSSSGDDHQFVIISAEAEYQ